MYCFISVKIDYYYLLLKSMNECFIVFFIHSFQPFHFTIGHLQPSIIGAQHSIGSLRYRISVGSFLPGSFKLVNSVLFNSKIFEIGRYFGATRIAHTVGDRPSFIYCSSILDDGPSIIS